MTPAEILKTRTTLGLTQKQAADRIGVTPQSWSNWEVGRTVPTHSVRPALLRLQRLAAKLTPDPKPQPDEATHAVETL